jgi:outer membrane receptor protein involved in Fe transport
MNRALKQHQLPMLCTLLLGGQLPAQVAPAPAATTPPPGEKKSEIVALSPFEVDASKDTGYYSAQTLAGGRLNTNLKDIASSVQVVTKEFMEDIGATSLDEVLAYTTNTEAMGPMSTFSATADPSGSGVLDQSEARQDPAGANRVRVLPDGTRIDEWDYFRANGGEAATTAAP